MKKKISATIFLFIFLFLANLISSTDCSTPGVYDETSFCNLNYELEPLKIDNSDCLNNYECLNGACTFNASIEKTICEPTYKAIREHTKFLQSFFDNLFAFFTGEEELEETVGLEELTCEKRTDYSQQTSATCPEGETTENIITIPGSAGGGFTRIICRIRPQYAGCPQPTYSYKCVQEITTGCSLNPECPDGFDAAERESCQGEPVLEHQIFFTDKTTSASTVQNFVHAEVLYFGINSDLTSWKIKIYLSDSDGLVDSFDGYRTITNPNLISVPHTFENLPVDKTYFLSADFESPEGTILASTGVKEISLVSDDTVPPTIVISNPVENQEYDSFGHDLVYSVDEPYLDSCWYSLDNGATNSSPDITCSAFTDLQAVAGQNIWSIYANDSSGNEARNQVEFTVISPDSPEIVSFTPPSYTEYYPDSRIVIEAEVRDNQEGRLSWEVISDISGKIGGGSFDVEADTPESVSLDFSLPISLLNSEQEHILVLRVNDSSGNFADSQNFALTLKNEDCDDNIDNDNDGILDSLDVDCDAEGISILRLSGLNNVLAYRTLDSNCEYASDFEDANSLKKCVKLNISGNICGSEDIDAGRNLVKFKNCAVGDTEQINTNLACYVSPDCNYLIKDASRKINITRFDICDEGDVGRGNISLSLNDPHNSDRFDNGDTIEFDLDVSNEYEDVNSSNMVLEIWLYDIDEEKILLNKTSNPLEIDFLEEDNFLLDLNLLEGIDYGNNLRLYYKVYKNNDEDFICRSESVRIYVNSRNCVDTDRDGYCSSNDCNNRNANINPLAVEICSDNLDNDCDSFIDEFDNDCEISDVITLGPNENEDFGDLSSSGARRLMFQSARLNFNIDSEEHSVLVGAISGNSAILTIFSESFNVSLTPGQTKDVDVNNDGFKELRILLNSILADKIDLTLRKIVQATSTPSAPEPSSSSPETLDGTFSKFLVITLIILILSIMGFIVFVIMSLMKKKHNFPKQED